MEQFIFECIEKFRPNTSNRKDIITPIEIAAPNTEAPKPSTPEKPDTNAKTRRLAVLCKVWGLVKFMHPFLSYKNIDWDGGNALGLFSSPKRSSVASSTETE